jgi:beta-glucosidase
MGRIFRHLISLVVNDTYACENDHTLNGLLKTELGFEGCAPASTLSQFWRLVLTARADVMSDWSATHSTESAKYGLDVRLCLRH